MIEEKDLHEEQVTPENQSAEDQSDKVELPETENNDNVEEDSTDVQNEKEDESGKETEETPDAEQETAQGEKTDDLEEQDDEEKQEEEVEEKVEHDDFDWAGGNYQGPVYEKKEYARLENIYEQTIVDLNENDIVSGKVTSVSDGDVVLDLNYKSNGIVNLSEFRNKDNIEVGDMVDVFIERLEDENGQLILSRRKARLLKAWEGIKDSYKTGSVIKGQVISKTKGGLIVDIDGLETFLPGSQIDIKPVIDYDSYVGKKMEFKVVKINEAIKNAVVSHKALIESDLAEQREEIIASLEKGQVLEGTVKNLTDFGAFMDLGGVDGLLYITDISWGRINHPSEVLSLNDTVNVVVLDFNEDKKRISLGLKQLKPHPWDVLEDEFKEGAKVTGKIVNIEDYGAFLEIQPGVEGLIHVSEVSWSNQPINAREYFTLGEDYEAIIATIDKEERKMSLSIKQLTRDPWDDIQEKYPVDSRHTGEVKNLTPYGVFVELEEGIGGMIHISDLSWTKRFSHPSEFTSVGDDIEIIILDIDKEERKLSLGHKQLEENPWDTFGKVFPVGSYHEATILRKDKKGAIVQLPYGLEAFAPISHLKKEDGSMAEVDDVLTFKVIEFNRDDKRILVSHRRYLDDIKREADQKVRNEKRKDQQVMDKNIKKQQSRIERTTLGELESFSELKSRLGNEVNSEEE